MKMVLIIKAASTPVRMENRDKNLDIYVCTYICVHACMYVWMHACMYVYMYVYVYIYMHDWVNARADPHICVIYAWVQNLYMHSLHVCIYAYEFVCGVCICVIIYVYLGKAHTWARAHMGTSLEVWCIDYACKHTVNAIFFMTCTDSCMFINQFHVFTAGWSSHICTSNK